MTCRALRLVIAGFVGTSIGGWAAVASAGDLASPQMQTLSVPQPVDPAAKPPSLNGLKAGAGLQVPASTTLSPLNGLALENLSYAQPLADASSPSTPAVTERGGAIRYSVAPDAGFTPFVGLGAGRATGLLNSGLSQPTPYDSSDALHSYQGQVGFDYKLDKDTHLDFDYRMSSTQRPNVPMLDNANIADQGNDRAAILSFHYSLDPVLRRPPD